MFDIDFFFFFFKFNKDSPTIYLNLVLARLLSVCVERVQIFEYS